MANLTVVPAYGRDYSSMRAARADWNANKDFLVADFSSFWDGKPINKEQADNAGYKVFIRYKRLTRICQA